MSPGKPTAFAVIIVRIITSILITITIAIIRAITDNKKRVLLELVPCGKRGKIEAWDLRKQAAKLRSLGLGFRVEGLEFRF